MHEEEACGLSHCALVSAAHIVNIPQLDAKREMVKHDMAAIATTLCLWQSYQYNLLRCVQVSKVIQGTSAVNHHFDDVVSMLP